FVQIVSDHMGLSVGLDGDSLHRAGVAVREAVMHDIQHGNRPDVATHVVVEFEPTTPEATPELSIRVRDQGEGFDPEEVANPLAPENLLKGSGRGIFLIRSFMDEMVLQRAPEGGMEMRMVKRVQPAGAIDPAP